GVLVEAVKDVTFRAAPLSSMEALEMINETHVATILDGFRNYLTVDKRSLADFISSVSFAIMKMENLSELDINPIIANESGIYPVDVRLVGKKFAMACSDREVSVALGNQVADGEFLRRLEPET
ncbi:hypothetical protein EN753_35585, partial [Mesorhizobium sp. M2A.F.Ca.ET.029.05.1.1]